MVDTIESEATEQRWLLAAQAFPELEQQANEAALRIIGSVALHGSVEIVPVSEGVANHTTLMAAIQTARLGDMPSRKTVESCVVTDIAERMFKAGHQSAVNLEIINGVISQNGRPLVDISVNSLSHLILNDEMMIRTRHELKNALLFEGLANAGILEDYNAVVFSPAPTDEKTKADYRFFSQTDTCSIQMMSKAGDELLLETALVAGKKTPDSERHDFQAIYQMAAQNGVEFVADDSADTLRYVMLVSKAATPDGVTDIVKEYDAAVGDVFYGEDRPLHDYQEYAEICRERNESFSSMVDQITDQLLNEATAFETPIEAIRRLDELSERVCVEYAITSKDVVALVFGTEAAYHIEQARLMDERGDTEGRDQALRIAQSTANSSSCPLFKDQMTDQGDSPDSTKAESKGSKWMNCPHCSAKVYDDPCAKVLSCWDCKATVINGVVISKGNGGSKKRREEVKMKQLEAQVDEVFEDRGVESLEEEEAKTVSTGKVAVAGV